MTGIDLGQAFGSVASTLGGAIADVLPVALGIFGTILAIKFGMKFIRSVAK